jgi:hypothetical protein
VIADRTMTWDATGYGSHAETSIGQPLTQWFLAEGATINGFDLFYLVQNPNDTAAEIQVRYLLPPPLAPLVKTYSVAPKSRFNIWVNTEAAVLDDAEMSAVVTSTNAVPVIVERAMYRPVGSQVFGAGHESAGVGAPALQWFFAEGATGPFFDLFFLVANPNAQASAVEARYLKPDGSVVTRTYTIPANSRFNIWVDFERAPSWPTPPSPPRSTSPTTCPSSSSGRCGGRAMPPTGAKGTMPRARRRRGRSGAWRKGRSAGRAGWRPTS